MKIKASLALLAALTISTSASASLIEFNFAGGGTNERELSFTSAGFTLNVSGERNSNPRRINWNNNGLGVNGNGSGNVNSLPGVFEGLNFALPVGALAWHSVEFWNFTRNETAEICSTFGVGSPCAGPAVRVDGIGRQNPQQVSIASFSSSQDLSIFAQHPFTGGFRIHSLTVDVPEPTGLALLLSGLAGLLLRRRRNL